MPNPHADLYASVHVLFWPWLWWQLMRLQGWMDEAGRGLLVAVDRWGNIHVRFIADAPGQGPRSIRAPVSARLAAALSCELEECPYPRRMPGSPAIRSVLAFARDPGIRRECGYDYVLPMPDT